ncbi:MAG: phosphate ABC transporter, permease protein PstA [Kordiimonadales bacterium]|nr:MAG: phosphate ABC transporter, permease protein PstA [Kordiimonadales bacterium]
MTNTPIRSPLSASAVAGLKKRYRSESLYRRLGLGAICASLGFLAFLLASILQQGGGAFFKTEIRFDITAEAQMDAEGDAFILLRTTLRNSLQGANTRAARRQAYALAGADAEEQLQAILNGTQSTGATPGDPMPFSIWLSASDEVDFAVKSGLVNLMETDAQNIGQTRLTTTQLNWLAKLESDGEIRTPFNLGFLTNGDSRDAERAGLGGAIMGSLFTLMLCFVTSFFVGVMAAVYLEEFAPKNLFTAFLEVNINNLASVPSIIFGLLGLAIFLNMFGMPRSSSLVGGMVLALMTLPTVIIASRVSLQSVPPSIREAALALGATRIQAVFHHVVPLALPGMLTGAILGMARALGETAPLLMIGMVAFIADPPSSVLDPAAALPVQVFLWSDSPERAFAEKTSGAILVLILFLILMNGAAIMLRKKFEKKW